MLLITINIKCIESTAAEYQSSLFLKRKCYLGFINCLFGMITKQIFWLRIVFRINYALRVVCLVVKIQKVKNNQTNKKPKGKTILVEYK